MERLLTFMLRPHPGAPSAGMAAPTYVSRLGIACCRKPAWSPVARDGMQSSAVGTEGLRPTLSDDLRLTRWSYLPLISGMLASSFRAADQGAPLSAFPQGWTSHRSAAVCAFHDADRHVYFSPAGGGAIRVFSGNRLAYEDLGFRLQAGGRQLGAAGYDPERRFSQTDKGFSVSCAFSAATFFFPSFLSRLVLRLGCSTALGARVYVRYRPRGQGAPAINRLHQWLTKEWLHLERSTDPAPRLQLTAAGQAEIVPQLGRPPWSASASETILPLTLALSVDDAQTLTCSRRCDDASCQSLKRGTGLMREYEAGQKPTLAYSHHGADYNEAQSIEEL